MYIPVIKKSHKAKKLQDRQYLQNLNFKVSAFSDNQICKKLRAYNFFLYDFECYFSLEFIYKADIK